MHLEISSQWKAATSNSVAHYPEMTPKNPRALLKDQVPRMVDGTNHREAIVPYTQRYTFGRA